MSLTIKEFWELKHRIDDEIARLDWDKSRLDDYIQKRYCKRSWLVLNDNELVHLLSILTSLTKSQSTTKRLRKRIGQKKRIGI